LLGGFPPEDFPATTIRIAFPKATKRILVEAIAIAITMVELGPDVPI